jgi:hypothetical protein
MAVLEAVLSPEWESRRHSFDDHWSETESTASMRSGSGDEYSIVFSAAGAYVRGFDHESPMSPYAEDGPWPGVLNEVPEVLAQGDEPTLKSPLADALTLAACCQVAPIRLLVAGPGLDGEISPDDLRPLFGTLVHTFTAEGVDAISSILEWHPSEATAMLAATARGARGICEVRDAGLPVPLTDEGPTVHEVDLDDAVSRNSLARAIMTTATLDEAEAYSREVCGFSEIDYERNKAA